MQLTEYEVLLVPVRALFSKPLNKGAITHNSEPHSILKERFVPALGGMLVLFKNCELKV